MASSLYERLDKIYCMFVTGLPEARNRLLWVIPSSKRYMPAKGTNAANALPVHWNAKISLKEPRHNLTLRQTESCICGGFPFKPVTIFNRLAARY